MQNLHATSNPSAPGKASLQTSQELQPMPTTAAGIRDASRRSLARLPMVGFFLFGKALNVSLLVGVCDWEKCAKALLFSSHHYFFAFAICFLYNCTRQDMGLGIVGWYLEVSLEFIKPSCIRQSAFETLHQCCLSLLHKKGLMVCKVLNHFMHTEPIAKQHGVIFLHSWHIGNFYYLIDICWTKGCTFLFDCSKM